MRPAAAIVAGGALLNLVHIPNEFAALPATWVDVAFGVAHNLLFIGGGLVGAFLAVRGQRPSYAALFAGSLAVAFHQGFLQLSQLGASQLPTVWPPMLIRLAVALSVAQFGAVLILVATARLRPGLRPKSPPR